MNLNLQKLAEMPCLCEEKGMQSHMLCSGTGLRFPPLSKKCPDCLGTGRPRFPCILCHGTGWVLADFSESDLIIILDSLGYDARLHHHSLYGWYAIIYASRTPLPWNDAEYGETPKEALVNALMEVTEA